MPIVGVFGDHTTEERIDRIFVLNDLNLRMKAVASRRRQTNRRAICIFVRDEVNFQERFMLHSPFSPRFRPSSRSFNLKIANQNIRVTGAHSLNAQPISVYEVRSKKPIANSAGVFVKPFQFRRNILRIMDLCPGTATGQINEVLLLMFIVYITLWWLYLRFVALQHTIHGFVMWRVNWTTQFGGDLSYNGVRLSCMKYTNNLKKYKNVL